VSLRASLFVAVQESVERVFPTMLAFDRSVFGQPFRSALGGS
jgi:hypothetical protein